MLVSEYVSDKLVLMLEVLRFLCEITRATAAHKYISCLYQTGDWTPEFQSSKPSISRNSVHDQEYLLYISIISPAKVIYVYNPKDAIFPFFFPALYKICSFHNSPPSPPLPITTVFCIIYTPIFQMRIRHVFHVFGSAGKKIRLRIRPQIEMKKKIYIYILGRQA